MSRHEPHFVSRYFLKMMLSYCLVIVVGLGLVSVFTTSWVTARLTEKEARVDRELVLQVRDYSDDKYRTIQNIFAQLYMPKNYYGNNSIMDYLNPRKEAGQDKKTKREVVSTYAAPTALFLMRLSRITATGKSSSIPIFREETIPLTMIFSVRDCRAER